MAADEVLRLLSHPDPAERLLALRLESVQPHHLRLAALRDRSLIQHILQHPACPPDLLPELMVRAGHPPEPDQHQPDPVQVGEVVRRACSDPTLVPEAVQAVQLEACPPGAVRAALDSQDPHLRLAAARAPQLEPDRALAVLRDAAGPGALPPPVRAAIVGRYRAGEDELLQGLQDPDHQVRMAVVRTLSHHVTPRVLERAVQSADPAVAARAARHPLADQQVRALAAQHASELVRDQVRDELDKAVRPEDLKAIGRATDQAGPAIVDHVPHLAAHPPEHDPDVQRYRAEVLESPHPVKRAGARLGSGGVSRKALYRLQDGTTYMVKPYFEKSPRRGWVKHRGIHGGWAEMTNQALYQAAGIGDLHQRVHVAEHPLSVKGGDDWSYNERRGRWEQGMVTGPQPALIVRLEPGAVESDHWPRGPGLQPADVMATRKIALMDFLTNNLDRHSGNLLVRSDGRPLAVDHSRSFQYHGMMDRYGDLVAKEGDKPDWDDYFHHYVRNSAHTNLDEESAVAMGSPFVRAISRNELNDFRVKQIHSWRPVFEWWGDSSQRVRAEMDRHLAQIRDDRLRQHVKRNFDARAAWLDDRARWGLENFGTEWWDQPVELHRLSGRRR